MGEVYRARDTRLGREVAIKVLPEHFASDARERSSSPDSVLATEAGRLLGTPTYMAPEQARGRPIDRRVDVWAFGCVLYECLTARRAFAGEMLSAYCVGVDGSGPPRRIGVGGPTDWSRDGTWISVMQQLPGTGLDVAVLRADGSGESQLVAATAASEVGGLFSPDSRWIGIGSDQGGEFRMYVAPVGRPGAPRPMTNFPPESPPMWLDGGRMVYQAVSGELHELPVTFRGEEVDVGEPRLSFGGRKVPTARPGSLSIARNGKRLLAIVPQNGAGEPPLVVVQHGLDASGR